VVKSPAELNVTVPALPATVMPDTQTPENDGTRWSPSSLAAAVGRPPLPLTEKVAEPAFTGAAEPLAELELFDELLLDPVAGEALDPVKVVMVTFGGMTAASWARKRTQSISPVTVFA
jgi:hypothetical protein